MVDVQHPPWGGAGDVLTSGWIFNLPHGMVDVPTPLNLVLIQIPQVERAKSVSLEDKESKKNFTIPFLAPTTNSLFAILNFLFVMSFVKKLLN